MFNSIVINIITWCLRYGMKEWAYTGSNSDYNWKGDMKDYTGNKRWTKCLSQHTSVEYNSFKTMNDKTKPTFKHLSKWQVVLRWKTRSRRSTAHHWQRSLEQQISRANYLSQMWSLSYTPDPTKDLDPLNFDWTANANKWTLCSTVVYWSTFAWHL